MVCVKDLNCRWEVHNIINYKFDDNDLNLSNLHNQSEKSQILQTIHSDQYNNQIPLFHKIYLRPMYRRTGHYKTLHMINLQAFRFLVVCGINYNR
jgi:hypothetical protein